MPFYKVRPVDDVSSEQPIGQFLDARAAATAFGSMRGCRYEIADEPDATSDYDLIEMDRQGPGGPALQDRHRYFLRKVRR